MEDYLKAIFRLQEQSERVTTQLLADHVKVAPASVTSMLKRLAEIGLVAYEPYRGVELTDMGRHIAVEMVRHHRLLELYLTQALGFSGDAVHAEAERLEHFISEELEERIDIALGRPTRDPHGSPIPTADGVIAADAFLSLVNCELEVESTILRIQDASGELMRLGLTAGAVVSVLGRPLGGKVHLRVQGGELLVGQDLCRHVRVCRRTPECQPQHVQGRQHPEAGR
jgi:DtxR family Mn-dependent transcriptional regulator